MGKQTIEPRSRNKPQLPPPYSTDTRSLESPWLQATGLICFIEVHPPLYVCIFEKQVLMREFSMIMSKIGQKIRDLWTIVQHVSGMQFPFIFRMFEMKCWFLNFDFSKMTLPKTILYEITVFTAGKSRAVRDPVHISLLPDPPRSGAPRRLRSPETV